MRFETLKPSRKRNRKCHIRRYDSVTEMVNTGMTESKKFIAETFAVDGERNHDGKWEWIGRKFNTPQEAIDAVNKIDPSVLPAFDDARSLLSKVMPEPADIKRVKTWDETDGDEFDRDRFMSGQQSWRRTTRRKMPQQKSITIAYLCGGSADVNHRDLVWTPATAAVLTDLLEQAGYSVKLICTDYSSRCYINQDDSASSIIIKEAGDSIDQTVLMNCATGWFFRVHSFADFVLGENQAGCNIESGYGRCADKPTQFLDPEEFDDTFNPSCELYELPAVYSLREAAMQAMLIIRKIEANQK